MKFVEPVSICSAFGDFCAYIATGRGKVTDQVRHGRAGININVPSLRPAHSRDSTVYRGNRVVSVLPHAATRADV